VVALAVVPLLVGRELVRHVDADEAGSLSRDVTDLVTREAPASVLVVNPALAVAAQRRGRGREQARGGVA
jgi:hypothetical protein